MGWIRGLKMERGTVVNVEDESGKRENNQREVVPFGYYQWLETIHP